MPIADAIFEARGAVEVGPCLEDDLTRLVDAHLSVGREPFDVEESEDVTIGVAVVREQARRIDDDRPVFENREPVGVCRWRIVRGDDPDMVGERGAGPARIDDVERDGGIALGIGREGDGSVRRIENRCAVRRGITVDAFVQADEAETVFFDVVNCLQQFGDSDARGATEANGLLDVGRSARRIVHRIEVELDRCRRPGARRILEDIAEAREAIEVSARDDLEIFARNAG